VLRVNQVDAPSTALPKEVPPPPNVAAHSNSWTGGRIAALVVGVVIALFALVLLGAGGTGVWADLTQREAGYVTTDVHSFSTAGSALATEPTKLGSAGIGWLYSPGVLDKVRIRVTPARSDASLFVGIGPAAAVDRYLAGVNRTVISEFFDDKVRVVPGGASGSAPETQDFWVASDTGSGARIVVWDPTEGKWTVVVMNADGQPGIDVRADLGAKLPAVLWIAIGLLAAGAVFLTGGVLLIVGAMRRRPASHASAAQEA
jgi:hypothetical protein